MKATYVGLAAVLILATQGCADSNGDDAGLDMRSRSTGERDERLGNDPAQQNTGRGSTPEDEPPPQGVPPQ